MNLPHSFRNTLRDTLRNSLRALPGKLRLAGDILRLPLARLHFDTACNPELAWHTYGQYTKPHPRYRLFRNKSLGMALIRLRDFSSSADYLQSVQRKDYAGYQSRKARERGYTVQEINRNDYIDDIHLINTSLAQRQGRPMDSSYLDKTERFVDIKAYRYYGVLDKDGRLVAYCNVAFHGNFAATDRLLGYKNSDGVMYLLLAEITCRLITEGQLHFFMYDTYLGAQPGLQNFKKKLGFQPYRIRFSIH